MTSDALQLLAQSRQEVPHDSAADDALKLAAMYRVARRKYDWYIKRSYADRALFQLGRLDAIEMCAQAVGCGPQFHALIQEHNS
jgi:hypothetical protein